MSLPTETLNLAPETQSYTIVPGSEVERVKVGGGLGKYRRVFSGSTYTVSALWLLDRSDFDTFISFYESDLLNGSKPFKIRLFAGSSTVGDHAAYFIPGTLSLTPKGGLAYVAKAKLEVLPRITRSETPTPPGGYHKLSLVPDIKSYSIVPGSDVERVSMRDGPGRYRRVRGGSTYTVGALWTLDNEGFNTFLAFYEANISFGSKPFRIDLVVETSSAVEHTAFFLPGSLSLKSQGGLTYVASAKLEVVPVQPSLFAIDLDGPVVPLPGPVDPSSQGDSDLARVLGGTRDVSKLSGADGAGAASTAGTDDSDDEAEDEDLDLARLMKGTRGLFNSGD